MTERRLDYGRMIAEALRDVARQALAYTAEEGMPGEHHFYLTFRTGAEGVHVPSFLRDQYPDEMMVVLQNQFWDLVVDDEGFSVTLTFGGSRHRVMVPWPALTAFADPSAQLGLRFEPEGGTETEEGEEIEGPTGPEAGEGQAGAEPGEQPAAWGAKRRAGAAAGAEEEQEAQEKGGEVIRLDRFRRRDQAPEGEGPEGEGPEGDDDGEEGP